MVCMSAPDRSSARARSARRACRFRRTPSFSVCRPACYGRPRWRNATGSAELSTAILRSRKSTEVAPMADHQVTGRAAASDRQAVFGAMATPGVRVLALEMHEFRGKFAGDWSIRTATALHHNTIAPHRSQCQHRLAKQLVGKGVSDVDTACIFERSRIIRQCDDLSRPFFNATGRSRFSFVMWIS